MNFSQLQTNSIKLIVGIINTLNACRNNLFYALLMGLIFIAFELSHRSVLAFFPNVLPAKEYRDLLLYLLIISFTVRAFRVAFIYIFVILCIAQAVHSSYFGYLIFPFEIPLLFTKKAEILEALPAIISQLLPPLVMGIFLVISVVLANKLFSNKLKQSKFFTILLVVMLCVNLLITNIINNPLGSRPNAKRSYFKSSLYLQNYFLSTTAPNMLFDIENIKSWQKDKLLPLNNNISQESKSQEGNIVLIMGESLAAKYTSIYGYEINNTPNLHKWAQEKNFVLKKAISAGIYTDTSIPMLLANAKQPNATTYIQSRTNNLFRLAKEHGYKTYFLTTQSHDADRYLINYIGVEFIDVLLNPVLAYNKTKYDSVYDEYLLDMLKNSYTPNTKNFILLNMSGSHEPYGGKYPKEYELLTGDSLKNQYLNSVYYTDHVLYLIKQFFDTSDAKATIIFTSDHGQHIEHGYGKGNFELESDYIVPFFLYENHDRDHGDNTTEELRLYLDQSDYITHYEMSNIVAYLLGYDALIERDFTAYVTGGELNGNAGYLFIKFDKKNIVEKSVIQD